MMLKQRYWEYVSLIWILFWTNLLWRTVLKKDVLESFTLNPCPLTSSHNPHTSHLSNLFSSSLWNEHEHLLTSFNELIDDLSVKPFYDLIKGFSFLYVFNDCFIEKKMVVGLVIASENRGMTGEYEFENHICRKKCVITPYKFYCRVVWL